MGLQLVGRAQELKTLELLLSSGEPEFLAIYGRRRVGKTFLIRQFFTTREVIFFSASGAKDAPINEQIAHFTQQLGEVFYQGANLIPGKNWDETFRLLTQAIQREQGDQKIVLFFDEFPWMATKNSRLLQNLDYYWNQHWSNDKRIKLIICGSSASWIIENIVNNKAGLHNRVTRNIYLEPFNLYQTRQFLHGRNIKLSNRHIVELFMVMGGIPYYLNRLEKGLSATQLVEALAFKRKSFLLEEFDNLFASLFNNSDVFVNIIKEVARCRYGLNQDALLKKLGTALQGKGGLQKLKALQDTGFIISFVPHGRKSRGVYYRVIDEYTLFYLHWIAPIKDASLRGRHLDGYWDKLKSTPSWYAWAGLAFESICYKHIAQIAHALALSPTAIPSTWRYMPKGSDEPGAQIDLLFDRDDDAITVCEIKYTEKPFVITKAYAEQLQQKIAVFKKVTKTQKQIFIAFISAAGIKQNAQANALVDGVVTLADLFESP